MSTLKAKVSNIEFDREFLFEAKNTTIYYYNVKLHDPESGEPLLTDAEYVQFSTNRNPQTKFEEGSVVEITYERIQKKIIYYKIDLSQAEKEKRKGSAPQGGYNKGQGGGSGYGGKVSAGQQKSITAQVAYEAARAYITVITAEDPSKVTTTATIKKFAKDFCDWMMEKHKGDRNSAIVLSKAIKEAVYILQFPNLELPEYKGNLREPKGFIELVIQIYNDINEIAK